MGLPDLETKNLRYVRTHVARKDRYAYLDERPVVAILEVGSEPGISLFEAIF